MECQPKERRTEKKDAPRPRAKESATDEKLETKIEKVLAENANRILLRIYF